MDSLFSGDGPILAAFAVARVPLALALDALLGEPDALSRRHPVVLIGRLVSFLEPRIRSRLPRTPRGEFLGGAVLAAAVCAASLAVPLALLAALAVPSAVFRSPALLAPAFVLDVFWGYQAVAARGLCDEAGNVVACLSRSLEEGRAAVSRIVGRDADRLDGEGVLRACVETVAEGTTDGIVSPLVFYALGGSPLAMLFKAVSTMDSMVGYRSPRYRHFGTAAARADDVANFVPARLAAVLMLASAAAFRLLGLRSFSPVRGLRVFVRDRLRHASPNSAQTESAAAGILGVRLGGGAFYGGVWEERPALGDGGRAAVPADVRRACALAWSAAVLSAALAAAAWAGALALACAGA